VNNLSARYAQAKILRTFRALHRRFASVLFAFFFIVAITGLLLGWKKHTGDVLQTRSYTGTTNDLSKWLSIDELNTHATKVLHDSISPDLSTDLDRIDIRKDKGMVKFIYARHFWEIQLDGATGKVLNINQRRSDFIEKIHDGSILDFYGDTSNGQFKLTYTSLMGIGLLVFTITGFWLWYGPKRMRNQKNS
jgi:uncharacterized iron-regulated membrane protein